MSATPDEVARLRRMVAEIDDTHGYSDDVLEDVIERYPLIDADGLTLGDDGWLESYDLNAAAADVWAEKAAAVANAYDFQADGGNFSRSQMHTQYARMQRYYSARRAHGTVDVVRV